MCSVLDYMDAADNKVAALEAKIAEMEPVYRDYRADWLEVHEADVMDDPEELLRVAGHKRRKGRRDSRP